MSDDFAFVTGIIGCRQYRVTQIGGRYPTQASGRTDDDHPFYFRARHGLWELTLGSRGAEDALYDDAAISLAEGEDDTGGAMPIHTVLNLLNEHLFAHPELVAEMDRARQVR